MNWYNQLEQDLRTCKERVKCLIWRLELDCMRNEEVNLRDLIDGLVFVKDKFIATAEGYQWLFHEYMEDFENLEKETDSYSNEIDDLRRVVKELKVTNKELVAVLRCLPEQKNTIESGVSKAKVFNEQYKIGDKVRVLEIHDGGAAFYVDEIAGSAAVWGSVPQVELSRARKYVSLDAIRGHALVATADNSESLPKEWFTSK